ncbi:MAG: 5-formyltetrahydrofolate cyclo-ligase [Eubacteriales bacterium]|nr:5-formyltetrahydrofolate cyclo-ligase [Eubacteriales bacterium]
MEKALLRKQIQHVLMGTEPSLLAERSLFICKNVMESPVFQNASTILCYQALPQEADPAYLAETAQRLGKRVAYPYCVDDRDMQALIPAVKNGWETGKYGIRTPVYATATHVKPEEIALVIVPGLAFDASGGRLGRGKGYYDRYLATTHAYFIGFAFFVQMLPSIPMQSHDINMHAIATEMGMQYIKNT